MNKLLYRFFTDDHRHLDGLLDKAVENPNEIQMDYYHQFRVGLLTHIKMEEKILFPAAQKANNGVPLPLAAALRLDHGALTSLMVVPPTASLIKVIRHILVQHDLAEEKTGGMYDACEALTQSETEKILNQLTAVSKVPVHPPNPSPIALEAAKRALQRAGYNYDQLAS
ncbi:MAG: hemerythrin domain-containing protein [Bacteroidetes bacterium]|nr:hemerythrin domain-containing protein [Bacteroidota bacterium]MBS1539359.1 hemerythrin domain-containing protein [Bacteroidota bacterium]